jgi:DNA recombination protein RmuC
VFITILLLALILALLLLLVFKQFGQKSDLGVHELTRTIGEIKGQLNALVDAQAHARTELRSEIEASRESQNLRLSEIKSEVDQKLSELTNRSIQSTNQLHESSQRSSEQLSERLSDLRIHLSQTLQSELGQLRKDNEDKLEKMRETVDEKLHSTLETRLTSSFKMVTDHLETVRTGLNDMQVLAAGVGDLKKVLTNIKTRGNIGEVQLGHLLEQLLIPEQYSRNQIVDPTSNERVDFAIRLPGQSDDKPVWLPIDAKFPTEDYQRLLTAVDGSDSEEVEKTAKALERRLKEQAESISKKYVKPPFTTDFGIMFLPTEGLYAEALRRPGLVETLQNQHRISLAGPTTIAALLNSLQMGFRTLSVQRRTSEVQRALARFKTEFDKFSVSLDKAHKKITEAGNSLSATQQRQRAVSRTLKNIDQLDNPSSLDAELLDLDPETSEDSDLS